MNAQALSLRDAAVRLENLILNYATGGTEREADYMALRDRLMADTSAKRLLPEWVRKSRSLSQFWAFIKQEAATYAERREIVWDAFRPLLDSLEAEGSPADEELSGALEALHAEHIKLNWQKALDRRNGDPEGAITAARTTLESVCKFILDDLDIKYAADDLPALYRKVAKALNLSPDDHTEQAFKQVLGGCSTVVNGLATLRNRLSDSHGQGAKPVRPLPRHASLAVNLAGTMGVFLVETWEARKSS